jgi:cytidyltransferase-like protein
MKRIGFTSGSFDPVTNGHMDESARAARMVDEPVVGIGVHPGKEPLFTPEERVQMLKAETAAIAQETGCDPGYVPNVGREQRVTYAMSNSFALGGLNAVLAFGRPPP